MAHANTVSKLQAVLIGAEAAHLHAMLDAGYKPAQIIRSYLVPVLYHTSLTRCWTCP